MADIVLSITIPEEHQQRIVDAFTRASGKELELSANHNMFDGRWCFNIDKKQQEETMKQFGERFLRELGKAVIRLVSLYDDSLRYKSEIGEIERPAQDVPDDILE